jgi:MFS family permease
MAGPALFASLAVPNYRRYFAGALTSNIGQWMSMTAKSWLVLVILTDSNATILGWLTAVMFLPQLLLSPVGGAVADRFPKRSVLLTTQTLFCLSAVTMSALVLSDTVQLWHVFALAFFDGLVMPFDGPSRQAFVSELVGRERLPNAIGLNSASFNAARLIGPGVSGIVIAELDIGWSFAVNAASFLVLIAMLLSLRPGELFQDPPPAGRDRSGLLEGFRYIFRRPDLVLLFTIGFAMGTFAFNYGIVNPLMTVEAFHRGVKDYGYLGSIMGVGSLVGALLAARRARPRVRHVYGFLGLFCVVLSLAALSPNFPFFAVTMVFIGLCSISIMVTCNTLIQLSTTPEVRGRVMAIWGLCMMGMTPVISPLLGWLGDTLGPRATVWFGAIPLTLTFLGVTWHLFARRGYRIHWAGRHLTITENPPTLDVHEPVEKV